MSVVGLSSSPELTSEFHQNELWTVSEAVAEHNVHTPLLDLGIWADRGFIEERGGTINDAYLDDLGIVQEAIGFQVDFKIARDSMEEFADFLGESVLRPQMRTAFDDVVARHRRRVNQSIRRTKGVFVRIIDQETDKQDTAELAAGPRTDRRDDLVSHSGQRVGRLLTCGELDEDSYYRFTLEGKNGLTFTHNPRSIFTQVIVDSSRTLSSAPVFHL
ncbi:MAG TPA: hypothetical protein VIH90_05610 [Candidatus Saccharimonadales bacterium]